MIVESIAVRRRVAQLLIEQGSELFPKSILSSGTSDVPADTSLAAIKVSWKLKHAQYTEKELEVIRTSPFTTGALIFSSTENVQQIRDY